MLKSSCLNIYVKTLLQVYLLFLFSKCHIYIFFALYEAIAFIVIRLKNTGSIAVKKCRAYKL